MMNDVLLNTLMCSTPDVCQLPLPQSTTSGGQHTAVLRGTHLIARPARSTRTTSSTCGSPRRAAHSPSRATPPARPWAAAPRRAAFAVGCMTVGQRVPPGVHWLNNSTGNTSCMRCPCTRAAASGPLAHCTDDPLGAYSSWGAYGPGACLCGRLYNCLPASPAG